MRTTAAALASAFLFGLTGCDQGDWFGGVERVAREAFHGWDMWETAAVQPYEKPLLAPVDGAVALERIAGFAEARERVAEMPVEEREKRSALAYRRFCHHCHGPNGDARIIVGESFGVPVPDLRSPEIQAKTDSEIYESVSRGTERIIPLAPIMTPQDRVLAIEYVRGLAAARSVPFFEPRNVVPLE